LIKAAIPQIITLLGSFNLDVCMAGTNALVKLSEQCEVKLSDLNIVDVLFIAEYRELIKAAIPQIITLLGSFDSDVCIANTNALVKLSEQCKVSKFLTCMLLMYS
jgi:hypothetical protein